MHPAGAGLRVAARQGQGVSVVGAAVEVALHQAHRAPVKKVDRGEQVHHRAVLTLQRSTKLASSRRPVAPDFSGWNWVPHT